MNLPGKDNYMMQLISDGLNSDRVAIDYKLTGKSISMSEIVKIHMVSGGGFLMKLK